jgi:outer membrane murein-binding lipoprotein Lpp
MDVVGGWISTKVLVVLGIGLLAVLTVWAPREPDPSSTRDLNARVATLEQDVRNLYQGQISSSARDPFGKYLVSCKRHGVLVQCLESLTREVSK